MMSPCKDCPDRYIGCHSSCNKYISYKNELEDFKAKVKKAKDKEIVFIEYKRKRRKHR